MKYILAIFISILPFCTIAQQLDCCESIEEVETFLNGEWKKTGGDSYKVYTFNFSGGLGEADTYRIEEDSSKKSLEKANVRVSILKKQDGFKLVYHWRSNLIVEKSIKHLDSNNLTIRLRTKKPSKLYRVSKF